MSEIIQLTNEETKPAGTVERRPISRAEGLRTGFRAGMWFWIIAVCSIPIPLLHFLLVPLNVALGTLRAWGYWTANAVLDRGDVACSHCGAKLVIENMAEKWPLKVLCSSCGHQSRLYAQ